MAGHDDRQTHAGAARDAAPAFAEPQLTAEETLLAELDRESAYRRLVGFWAGVVFILAVGLSAFHAYTGAFGILPPQLQRAPHLGLALGLIFLLYPARRGNLRGVVSWYDVLFAALGLGVGAYHLIFYKPLLQRAGDYTTLDHLVAAIAVLLILEATRRVAGWTLVVVTGCFLAYAFLGPYMPGFLRHRGFSLERVLSQSFLHTEGAMGLPIGVSSGIIYIYLMFATFLSHTGIRQLFVDVAMALTGRTVGGPAKAAVISSALEGTISGSSIANTAGSGSFTIPMMKNLGYRPEFAAAVEASASTGGQIMPPVMGAAAFIMAEFMGIPYIEIAKAAAIPAILYFLGVFLTVHFEARRVGLKALTTAELPRLKDVLLKQGYLFIPLVVIVWLMAQGFTPSYAAVWGIVVSWVAGLFKRETRMGPRRILDAFAETARGAVGVIAACASAGLILGIVTLTGLGLKLSNNLVELAGNNLYLSLFLTMIASLVLGMGLPTSATYIVLATMAAPALLKLGVPQMAAHLFVFYFGIVADITPPVALAVYTGAAIARSDPWRTGIEAVKLAVAAFLIPYMFAVSPQLILIGTTPLGIAQVLLTATFGMISLSAGVTGFLIRKAPGWQRVALVAAGLMLVDPGVTTDVIGAALLAGVYLAQRFQLARAAAAGEAA